MRSVINLCVCVCVWARRAKWISVLFCLSLNSMATFPYRTLLWVHCTCLKVTETENSYLIIKDNGRTFLDSMVLAVIKKCIYPKWSCSFTHLLYSVRALVCLANIHTMWELLHLFRHWVIAFQLKKRPRFYTKSPKPIWVRVNFTEADFRLLSLNWGKHAKRFFHMCCQIFSLLNIWWRWIIIATPGRQSPFLIF
jgi:hypothetical protein